LASGASTGVAPRPQLSQESVIIQELARTIADDTDSMLRVDALPSSNVAAIRIVITADEGQTDALAHRLLDEYTASRSAATTKAIEAANSDIDTRVAADRARIASIDDELKSATADSNAFVDALNVERTLKLSDIADLTARKAGNERFASETAFGIEVDIPTTPASTGGLLSIAKSSFLAIIVAVFLGAAITLAVSKLDQRAWTSEEPEAWGVPDLGSLPAGDVGGARARFLAANVLSVTSPNTGIVLVGVSDRTSADAVAAALKGAGAELSVVTAAPLDDSAEVLDVGCGKRVVLVVRLRRDSRESVLRAVRTLRLAGVEPAGVIALESSGRLRRGTG
jgi:hypothetical protein